MKFLKFKDHFWIKIFLIGNKDWYDEELKKIILFDLFKPVDFMILNYDYNKGKLVKYKDNEISHV